MEGTNTVATVHAAVVHVAEHVFEWEPEAVEALKAVDEYLPNYIMDYATFLLASIASMECSASPTAALHTAYFLMVRAFADAVS